MTEVHHFSSLTGEYLSSSLAAFDPLDQMPMVPAFATIDVPPVAGDNQTAQFDGVAWLLVDDFRGYVGFDPAGNRQEINDLDMAPDAAWTVIRPFILSEAKEIKRGEIRVAFGAVSLLTVEDGNGIAWSGGFDSALKMDAAKRMAEIANLTVVSLFDANNIEHVLAIADAETVILSVGYDYQTNFAHKQALMVAVDALPVDAVQVDLDVIAVAF